MTLAFFHIRYAHLKEQLDQYFADLSAQRDADRAAAIAAAEAEGELPPVFEDKEDPYVVLGVVVLRGSPGLTCIVCVL